MSGKNATGPRLLVSGGDMSADYTSPIIDVQYADNVGLQLIFTGTPTGLFYIQGSINYDPRTTTGDWSNLDFSSAPEAAGAADNHLINLNQLPYKYIRVFYDRTSGSGSLSIYFMIRQVGS